MQHVQLPMQYFAKNFSFLVERDKIYLKNCVGPIQNEPIKLICVFVKVLANQHARVSFWSCRVHVQGNKSFFSSAH